MRKYPLCKSVLNLTPEEENQIQEFLNANEPPGRDFEEDCAPSDNYYFTVRGSSIGPIIKVHIVNGPYLEVDSAL